MLTLVLLCCMRYFDTFIISTLSDIYIPADGDKKVQVNQLPLKSWTKTVTQVEGIYDYNSIICWMHMLANLCQTSITT